MQLNQVHENVNILHIGTEEPRAYYIPFHKETGDRVTWLNGDDWKFQWYETVYEVPDNFIHGQLDGFDTITVPSCINMLGYEPHQYANVRGPIPFDPPYVPLKNPCGAYGKEFQVNLSENQQYYLNFDGVDSCYYVWVNGTFVGYSQVSHATSEFHITEFLKDGMNQLSVLIFKWCDGTYFEDQDKLRMSGIFRDVYLLERPKNHIRDFTIETDVKKEQANIHVAMTWSGKEESVTIMLYGPDQKLVAHKECKNDVTIEVKQPSLWSAETPYLYTMIIESNKETITQKVGIRQFEIKDSILYLNGTKIKIKGVNRHDSNAYTGYVISKEQLIADLKLMKEHNINAIRTSHYPSAPWAYELYSEYGFYIMSEADIETHNTELLYAGGRSNYNYREELIESSSFGILCSDKQYEEVILDRVKHCVIREKNQPCIMSWSLGNESGYGCNMEAAARWVKEQNPNYIVHYESSIYYIPGHTNDLSNIDLYSRMYMPVKDCENYCKQPNKKPLVLCEYSHAMGNSCGDLEDYFKVMYQYDNFCGGYVWEWCDHSVYAGIAENGKKKFLYGGDFGEFPVENNFCMDGLIAPDRLPHTSLKEYKNVARPIRAKKKDKEILFYNTMDFVSAEQLYAVQWEIQEDFEVVKQGEITDYHLAPHTWCSLNIPVPESTEGKTVTILIRYCLKENQPLVEKGSVMGFDQFILSVENDKNVLPKETSSPLEVSETIQRIVIHSESVHYEFDKWKGIIDNIVVDGKVITEKPVDYNIWRAPADNDKKVIAEWRKAGYDRKTVRVYETKVIKEESNVIIECSLGLGAQFLQNSMKLKAVYTIHPDGTLDVSLKAEKDPVFPYLPRFGLRFFLPKEFESVTYRGYGPGESYVDKHHACYYGQFKDTVTNMLEDYIRPQENGSHTGCNYICLTDETRYMEVTGENLSVNASHYTQEQLEQTTHNFLLEESNFTVLCVDGANSGIGSGSCGPVLIEEYQVNETTLTLNMTLKFGCL